MPPGRVNSLWRGHQYVIAPWRESFLIGCNPQLAACFEPLICSMFIRDICVICGSSYLPGNRIIAHQSLPTTSMILGASLRLPGFASHIISSAKIRFLRVIRVLLLPDNSTPISPCLLCLRHTVWRANGATRFAFLCVLAPLLESISFIWGHACVPNNDACLRNQS